jgi:hypothetical protein
VREAHGLLELTYENSLSPYFADRRWTFPAVELRGAALSPARRNRERQLDLSPGPNHQLNHHGAFNGELIARTPTERCLLQAHHYRAKPSPPQIAKCRVWTQISHQTVCRGLRRRAVRIVGYQNFILSRVTVLKS